MDAPMVATFDGIESSDGLELARSGQIEDWLLTEQTTRRWTVASVAVSIAGVGLFALAYALGHGDGDGFAFTGLALLGAVVLTAVLTLPLYVVHEWIHGLTMRRFGVRPRYGWGAVGGVPGYLYCAACGARFTRGQYATVALAPCLLLSTLGALAVALLPWGGWLVVPLAFHLGGCVGDFWAVALVLRRPPGTVVEDLTTGVRFHLPE